MLFIILGIFVLAIALLVVYIESKSREQNHKIGSMLSLVSSLAEELQSIKLQRFSGGTNDEQNSLVTVSDGDDETLGDDESLGDDNDDDDDDNDDNDDDDNDDEDENDDDSVIEVDNREGTDISNIKILKLTLNADENESVTSNDLEDLEELEDLDNDVESLQEEQSVALFDLKSINISNLEEKEEIVELRKQPVNKLRSIVAEKGLAPDPSKLKKPELLKLLGAE
jgi:hypothetical protein